MPQTINSKPSVQAWLTLVMIEFTPPKMRSAIFTPNLNNADNAAWDVSLHAFIIRRLCLERHAVEMVKLGGNTRYMENTTTAVSGLCPIAIRGKASMEVRLAGGAWAWAQKHVTEVAVGTKDTFRRDDHDHRKIITKDMMSEALREISGYEISVTPARVEKFAKFLHGYGSQAQLKHRYDTSLEGS